MSGRLSAADSKLLETFRAMASDPFQVELDRRLALEDLRRKFEETWEGSIEWDWQNEIWPTFKEMAHDLWQMGYTHAVIDQMYREKADGA